MDTANNVSSDTHQAIVWLMARISEKEAKLNRFDQRLTDLQKRCDELERDNHRLKRHVATLSSQFGMSTTTEHVNSSGSLPTTPVDNQLHRSSHNSLTIPVSSSHALSLPHDNNGTGSNSSSNNNNHGRIAMSTTSTSFPLLAEQPPTPPSLMSTSLSGQSITHSMSSATSPSSSDIIQSVLALSQMEASSSSSSNSTSMIVDDRSTRPLVNPTPWHKYGLDKNAYILIRDYLRGTLRQALQQNSEINGHRYDPAARLGDPINIEFRQAVAQQILALGELTGTNLSMEIVEKRVAVYLQNYRTESKKTPSELKRDRYVKRLRSQQRRDEAKRGGLKRN
ncbi:hypothetical protein BDF22DRAFT_696974 [Syncephalis plumigaleata]|nr:hypothetical protein BDF22DRAFT_696974 [Syncephalis plumigaleata]